jgi:hypothetical protein
MNRIYLKSTIICGMVFLFFVMASCGDPTNSSSSPGTPTPVQQEVSTNPTIAPSSTATHAHSAPVVATPTSTPGTGPLVILTPTPLPGGSSNGQLVTLPDRTLAINSASKQQGMDANSTAISLVMTINNTGAKPILNQATYYLLVGSEGDIFGYQSSATAGYFGTIAPHNSRSGTIVFQVPAAAVKGLRLMFRPEIVQETVFVALSMK